MAAISNTRFHRFVVGLGAALRGKPKSDHAIDKEFVESENDNSVAGDFITMVFDVFIVSITLSVIGYVAVQMFVVYAGPGEYLVHLIVGLYAAMCRAGAKCSVAYLNAALVVAVPMLIGVMMVLMHSVRSFSPVDDLRDLHAHLNLVSKQIIEDYNGLAALDLRLRDVEEAVKAADERVDMVVEGDVVLKVVNGETSDVGKPAPTA